MKQFLTLLLLILASTSLLAKPYFGIQLGLPSISTATTQYDNASARLSFGYEAPVTPDFSFLFEAGYNPAQNFDAGLAHVANDPAHVQMHLGSRLDGLVGFKYRMARVSFVALGGVTNASMNNEGMGAENQETLSQSLPVVALRLGYQYNPHVSLVVGVNKVMGQGTPLFVENRHLDLVLKSLPSVTNVYAGIQLGL